MPKKPPSPKAILLATPRDPQRCAKHYPFWPDGPVVIQPMIDVVRSVDGPDEIYVSANGYSTEIAFDRATLVRPLTLGVVHQLLRDWGSQYPMRGASTSPWWFWLRYEDDRRELRVSSQTRNLPAPAAKLSRQALQTLHALHQRRYGAVRYAVLLRLLSRGLVRQASMGLKGHRLTPAGLAALEAALGPKSTFPGKTLYPTPPTR